MTVSPAASDDPLSVAALVFRSLHAAIAAGFLLAIAEVWRCALGGRRGTRLRVAVAGLVGEGVLVAINGGDCPLGPLQQRLGDPVPLFEVVLSPTAARRAVPVLGVVAATGIAMLAGNRGKARSSDRSPGRCERRRALPASTV